MRHTYSHSDLRMIAVRGMKAANPWATQVAIAAALGITRPMVAYYLSNKPKGQVRVWPWMERFTQACRSLSDGNTAEAKRLFHGFAKGLSA